MINKITKDTMIPVALVVTLMGSAWTLATTLERLRGDISTSIRNQAESQRTFMRISDFSSWLLQLKINNPNLYIPPVGF